jgi:hypothetical protein
MIFDHFVEPGILVETFREQLKNKTPRKEGFCFFNMVRPEDCSAIYGLVPSGSALRAAQTSGCLFVELYRSNFSGAQNKKSTY